MAPRDPDTIPSLPAGITMTVVSDKVSVPIVPLTTDTDIAKSGITISRTVAKDPWGSLAKKWVEEEEEEEDVSSEVSSEEDHLEVVEEECSDSEVLCEAVRRRFGSMTFSDYDSAADGDFHPEEEEVHFLLLSSPPCSLSSSSSTPRCALRTASSTAARPRGPWPRTSWAPRR